MISKTIVSGPICSFLQLARLFFAIQKPYPDSGSSIRKLKLSDDLQRALWAQAFINLILSQQPSFQQIKKQSLHSRLLNLEWPYSEITKEYQLSKQIEEQMKRFFMPKVGVYLPLQFYSQYRFYQGQSENEYITFYPTYSITKQMFSQFLQCTKCRMLFLYGKWGIGKSQSIILYCMLAMYIQFYIKTCPDSQQLNKFRKFLKTREGIYWSIHVFHTETILKSIIYYQKRWMWFEQQFRHLTDQQLVQKFQQKFQKVQKNLTFKQLIAQISGIAFFDQINVMASVMRKSLKHQQQIKILKNQLQKLQNQNINNNNNKKEQIKFKIQSQQKYKQKQKQRLSNLKNLFSLVCNPAKSRLYNSSSNIQSQLLSQDNLALWTKHENIKTTPLLYQFKISRKKDNVALLQLSQFFTNIVQEFATFSKEIIQQWDRQSTPGVSAREKFFMEIQNLFMITEWKSIPNAHSIILLLNAKKQKLQQLPQLQQQTNAVAAIKLCKNSKQLKEVMSKIIESLLVLSELDLKKKVEEFFSKSVGDDVSKLKRRTMGLIYQKALQKAVKQQNLHNKEQLYFTFQITASDQKQFAQIMANIDRNIFTFAQQSLYNKNKILISCSLSPWYVNQVILSVIYGKFINVRYQIISPKFEDDLISSNNFILGKQYDKNIVKLFMQQKIGLIIHTQDKYGNKKIHHTIKKYFIHKIDNFQKKQNCSFQQKFEELFKIQQVLNHVCIPQQFYNKELPANHAFDIVHVSQVRGHVRYNFIDITLAMDRQIHKLKIINFVQMLSRQIQFQQLTKPAYQLKSSQKLNKIIQKYKGKIIFTILSLNGRNSYLNKNYMANLLINNQKLHNLVINLDVQFYKCYTSQQTLQRQKILQKQDQVIFQFNKLTTKAISNKDQKIKRNN